VITTAGVIISALIAAWVELSGPGPASTRADGTSASSTMTPSVAVARPQITSPEREVDTHRDVGVELSGTTPELDDGQELWILDESSDGTYYVSGRIDQNRINVIEGTWSFTDKPFGAEGEEAEFFVRLILANPSCAAKLQEEQAGDGTLEQRPQECKPQDKLKVNVTP